MEWPDLKRKFCRIASKKGVRKVADAIPADAKTVYRLIKGETLLPSRAVRASMARIVAEDESHASDMTDTGKE